MIEQVFADNYKIYVNTTGSVWVDITSDVISTIDCDWGIRKNTRTALLADYGQMKFVLNNTDGIYTPNSTESNDYFGLRLWKSGVKVKLVITYDGSTYTRFYGSITAMDIQSGTVGLPKVGITCTDWIGFATKAPVKGVNVEADKRGDEALATIVESMPVQPLATSYEPGFYTFPAVFNDLSLDTKAYSEMNKIALSELGYIYLKKDKLNGETLVFESALSRNGLRELTPIPVPISDSGFLLKEDGGYLLKEDGGKILLNESETFVADNNMTSLEVTYGQNVINYIKTIAHPTTVDSSPVVLFSLGTKMAIGKYKTITIKGNYANPVGGATLNAFNMEAPVATTDYTMNTNKTGTGTNLTAALVVNAEYDSAGVTYTLFNSGSSNGYITKLQARGYGIYSYNQIEDIQEDLDSITEYGYQSETIDQVYQNDLVYSSLFAKNTLDTNKQPNTVLNKIHMIANSNGDLMNGFLNLDVGDLIHIQETKTGIDGWYYIQGVEFSIALGGTIYFAWTVKESLSVSKGLTPLALMFSGSTSSDAVDFGYLPQVSNLVQRTWSVWIYPTLNDGSTKAIMGIFSDDAGTLIYMAGRGICLYSKQGDPAGASAWFSGASINMNAWNHICITRDTTYELEPPKMYINGVLESSLNWVTLPNPGAMNDETGSNFMIGNVNTPAYPYTRTFKGSIKDARIYNRVLDSSEALALASGSIVTNGLVFQAPCCRTRDSAYYNGEVLTSETPVIDNVYGMVGIINGSPISTIA